MLTARRPENILARSGRLNNDGLLRPRRGGSAEGQHLVQRQSWPVSKTRLISGILITRTVTDL